MSRHPNSKPMRVIGSQRAVATTSTPKKQAILRKKIEADVEAFLARGGVISEVGAPTAPAEKPKKKNRMGRNW